MLRQSHSIVPSFTMLLMMNSFAISSYVLVNLKKMCSVSGSVLGVLGFWNAVGMAQQPAAAPAVVQIDPSEHLFKLGFKFQPAAT